MAKQAAAAAHSNSQMSTEILKAVVQSTARQIATFQIQGHHRCNGRALDLAFRSHSQSQSQP